MTPQIWRIKFNAGSRVVIQLWEGWPYLPATVLSGHEWYDKDGVLRQRRMIMLDEHIDDGPSDSRRWNVALRSLRAPDARNPP